MCHAKVDSYYDLWYPLAERHYDSVEVLAKSKASGQSESRFDGVLCVDVASDLHCIWYQPPMSPMKLR